MVKLSVIIPTLNEAAHVERLVRSIAKTGDGETEIFFVDGGSTDGTREQVLYIASQNPQVCLVENPDRYVSNGFNRAYKLSKGRFVSLVGAHAIYPEDYFQRCIEHIERGECEVAGGFLLHKGRGVFGAAVAHCMASQFGVGNTEFRTVQKKMYVDSVAFAVYDRRVFEQAGLFDEALLRNQDDEFHYRLNRAGFRILMLPNLEASYFVRDSLPKLFSQYYQYGFFKPLVFKKVPRSIRLRHLAPAAFVLYLLSLPLALVWVWWVLPLVLYLSLDLLFSLSAKINWPCRFAAMAAFPTLHIAYGLGCLTGVCRWSFQKS